MVLGFIFHPPSFVISNTHSLRLVGLLSAYTDWTQFEKNKEYKKKKSPGTSKPEKVRYIRIITLVGVYKYV